MTKTTNHGNVNFHATVPTYRPPIIESEFIDDDGELNYALANGHTTLADRYNSIWNPTRSMINWKSKGENPDKTKIK